MKFEIKAIQNVENDKTDLVSLLIDAVDSQASIGFYSPLSNQDAAKYWQSVAEQIKRNEKYLWIARDEQGVIGSVQLSLCQKDNGRHRAEVEKLMVHRRARRNNVAKALLSQLEASARASGIKLLVLDTRKGDSASCLYLQFNYQLAGEIPKFVSEQSGEFSSTLYFFKDLSSAD